jgi:glutamate N-acetyltransferase/amino-acid N-acetyltransferase
MATLAAEAVGCKPEQILVASTGVIGRLLPMACFETGIPRAAQELAGSGAALVRAAHAILTTDTIIKVATRCVTVGGKEIRLTGLAKGAAMIGPNMATMLAFVLTDAAVAPADLAHVTVHAADQSFHSISVEGHTSTNDSLIFLANGKGPPLSGADLARFEAEATAVCTDLARAIVADAEGAQHLVTIDVEGLRDDAEARRVAKAIADSALVKTAIYGADPNWGRIVSAAGYAGVAFDEDQLSLWLGDLSLYQAGAPLPFDAAAASNYLKKNRAVHIRLRFTLGTGKATYWTCDLTPEYVRLNADYTT